MSGILQDVRYTARQLRSKPGFTIVCVLTLALGIGASTAIFSAVNPILFEPLPYPHADRIMMIWNTYQGARAEIAFGTYRELVERSGSFEAMAAFQLWQPAMTGDAQPERLDGQRASASFFRVLGIQPFLGRDFLASEDVFHGPKVAILSDKLWRRKFNGDRTIIGHQVKLDGDIFTIIDPALQLNQLEQVQRDVATLLEHGLNPVETPALATDANGSNGGEPSMAATEQSAAAPEKGIEEAAMN